jgi:hypothetical protein
LLSEAVCGTTQKGGGYQTFGDEMWRCSFLCAADGQERITRSCSAGSTLMAISADFIAYLDDLSAISTHLLQKGGTALVVSATKDGSGEKPAESSH